MILFKPKKKSFKKKKKKEDYTKFAVAELKWFTQGFIHIGKYKNEKKERDKHARYFRRCHLSFLIY